MAKDPNAMYESGELSSSNRRSSILNKFNVAADRAGDAARGFGSSVYRNTMTDQAPELIRSHKEVAGNVLLGGPYGSLFTKSMLNRMGNPFGLGAGRSRGDNYANYNLPYEDKGREAISNEIEEIEEIFQNDDGSRTQRKTKIRNSGKKQHITYSEKISNRNPSNSMINRGGIGSGSVARSGGTGDTNPMRRNNLENYNRYGARDGLSKADLSFITHLSKSVAAQLEKSEERRVSERAKGLFGTVGILTVLPSISFLNIARYSTQLPNAKKVGVLNAINVTLGMLYSASRVNMAETNRLLYDLAIISKQGLNVDYRIQKPAEVTTAAEQGAKLVRAALKSPISVTKFGLRGLGILGPPEDNSPKGGLAGMFGGGQRNEETPGIMTRLKSGLKKGAGIGAGALLLASLFGAGSEGVPGASLLGGGLLGLAASKKLYGIGKSSFNKSMSLFKKDECPECEHDPYSLACIECKKKTKGTKKGFLGFRSKANVSEIDNCCDDLLGVTGSILEHLKKSEKRDEAYQKLKIELMEKSLNITSESRANDKEYHKKWNKWSESWEKKTKKSYELDQKDYEMKKKEFKETDWHRKLEKFQLFASGFGMLGRGVSGAISAVFHTFEGLLKLFGPIAAFLGMQWAGKKIGGIASTLGGMASRGIGSLGRGAWNLANTDISTLARQGMGGFRTGARTASEVGAGLFKSHGLGIADDTADILKSMSPRRLKNLLSSPKQMARMGFSPDEIMKLAGKNPDDVLRLIKHGDFLPSLGKGVKGAFTKDKFAKMGSWAREGTKKAGSGVAKGAKFLAKRAGGVVLAAGEAAYDVYQGEDMEGSVIKAGSIGAGAALGATIGSVVPVVGTVIGAIIGGILGWVVDKFFGDQIKEAVGKFTDGIILGVFRFGNWIQDKWDDIKHGTKGILVSLQNSLEIGLASLVDAVTGMMGGLATLLLEKIGSIPGLYTALRPTGAIYILESLAEVKGTNLSETANKRAITRTLDHEWKDKAELNKRKQARADEIETMRQAQADIRKMEYTYDKETGTAGFSEKPVKEKGFIEQQIDSFMGNEYVSGTVDTYNTSKDFIGKKYDQASTQYDYAKSAFSAGYSGPVKVPEEYREMIERHARNEGVDPKLIAAIIQAESGWRPKVSSNKGAGGLMQLMPGTAAEMGVTDRFDVDQNIMGGTRYIRKMLDTYHGDLPVALAAYNAGPGNVNKYGGIPPFEETEKYVKKVMGYYDGSIPYKVGSVSKSAVNTVKSTSEKVKTTFDETLFGAAEKFDNSNFSKESMKEKIKEKINAKPELREYLEKETGMSVDEFIESKSLSEKLDALRSSNAISDTLSVGQDKIASGLSTVGNSIQTAVTNISTMSSNVSNATSALTENMAAKEEEKAWTESGLPPEVQKLLFAEFDL